MSRCTLRKPSSRTDFRKKKMLRPSASQRRETWGKGKSDEGVSRIADHQQKTKPQKLLQKMYLFPHLFRGCTREVQIDKANQ